MQPTRLPRHANASAKLEAPPTGDERKRGRRSGSRMLSAARPTVDGQGVQGEDDVERAPDVAGFLKAHITVVDLKVHLCRGSIYLWLSCKSSARVWVDPKSGEDLAPIDQF